MKPQLLKVSMEPSYSFSVRQDMVPHINNKWHYHQEVELIHFKKGKGTQFIGDNVSQFKYGDIVLVGAHLPHYWRFDEQYFKAGAKINADVRVVHFCENFWGDGFLKLPENENIRNVLEKARRGIRINGKTKEIVAELLEKMLGVEGPERIMLLMRVLLAISGCNRINMLSSISFDQDSEESESKRINAVYDYTLANFRKNIKLKEIADIASISPNSFCRYFKSRTRKTYSQFLMEVKVDAACKLLIDNKLGIKQVCYESGFNNIVSFHKYFKLVTHKSPLIYQKEFV
jgi:AraC-like DNA-binding protein